MKRFAGILLGLVLVGRGGVALAEPRTDESTPQQVAYGVGSVLGTVMYAPFKATFCILGSLTSAATVIVSRPAAERVIGASCRGTWAITPDALRGRETVDFVGDVPTRSGRVAGR